MVSKKLLMALVDAVRASPIHERTRIYVHQTEGTGFWQAVFIDEDASRISRISHALDAIEHLFGGGEHCSTTFHSTAEFACLEVR